MERSSLGIAHRKLMNSVAQYRKAGPESCYAEASHQKPPVMTPNLVAECANLLAAGYRPEAIARCLRPPTGADSTESIHSIFCKRSNKALRQNCCAFPACLTNVACECRMREAVTLHQLDDVVTGSLHGFPGANDYRLRASSKP